MTKPIQLTLQPYSALTPEEEQTTIKFLQLIFGPGYIPIEWAPVDWITRIFIDGQLVSHVSISERTCDVGGKPVWVGGIGGVATLPEYRGRGYARQALAKTAEFMLQVRRVDFGLLFCGPSMEAYYQALGWKRIEAPVYYDQPERKLLDGVCMVLPCTAHDWPEGVVDVCGLPW